MEDGHHRVGTPRAPWYWAVALFSAVVVFVPLSLATMVWVIGYGAQAAGTCFATLVPVTWLAAVFVVRRKSQVLTF